MGGCGAPSKIASNFPPFSFLALVGGVVAELDASFQFFDEGSPFFERHNEGVSVDADLDEFAGGFGEAPVVDLVTFFFEVGKEFGGGVEGSVGFAFGGGKESEAVAGFAFVGVLEDGHGVRVFRGT